jgi:predicted O-methyltransferase YrrM
MHAFQGVPKRHAYMQALVDLLSRGKPRQPVKILEVGSWAGGSAITWAKALKKYCGEGQVVCVDQWQPYFDTEINSAPIYQKMNDAAADGSIYRLFLHNVNTSGLNDVVSPIVGNSRQILPTLKREEFSIVYLDASHLYRDVVEDIRLSLALVKNGGFLCGDDLELQQSEIEAADLLQDVEAGIDYTRSKVGGTYYHPGVTMAVSEIFGEVSSWDGFWAMRKTQGGWEKVDLSRCEIEIPGHLSAAESASLKPVATYAGFNIVQAGETYYGLRQSVGEVDLTVGQEVISKQYREEDVFVGFSIDHIRVHIDQLKFSQKLTTALETETDALVQQAALLAAENQRLKETMTHKLAEIQAQLDAHTMDLRAFSATLEKADKALETRIFDVLSEHASSLEKEYGRVKERLSVLERPWWRRLVGIFHKKNQSDSK